MRRLNVACGAAMTLLAGALSASAAEPSPMFDTFEAVCLSSDLDSTGMAVEAARRGFVVPKQGPAIEPGYMDPKIFVLGAEAAPSQILSFARRTDEGGTPPIASLVCWATLTKPDDATDEAFWQWLRESGSTSKFEDGTMYRFHERPEGRVPIEEGDEKALAEAFAKGELLTVFLVRDGDMTHLATSRPRPPRSAP